MATMRPIAVVATIAMAFITVAIAAVMEPQRGDREHAAAAAVTAVADLQLSALISLYNATGGPHWANNAGWSSVPLIDPCITGTSTWYGVVCNGANVTYVGLRAPFSEQLQTVPPVLDLGPAS